MEAHRGPTGSAALLPYEIALIEELGLTVDEYREFQRLTAEYDGKRNDGIAPVNAELTTVLVVAQLVIGVALTAAAAMMKPKPVKPPEQDSTTNLETGDNVGRSKFAPRYGFDSVQQLATLGKPVPLVFAHRMRAGLATHETPVVSDRITSGGIRINTQLVWSQLLSHPTNQELRIAAVIGLARFGVKPEYEGYAIGSTKLESYPPEVVYLAFNKEGKRPVRNSRSQTYIYKEAKLKLPQDQPDDLLSTRIYNSDMGPWNLVSCSAHTPSTAKAFGMHGHMPNGTAWMLPFTGELVPVNNNSKGQQISEQSTRDEIRMILIKNNLYQYPNGAGFVDPRDSGAWKDGRRQVNPGDRGIFYKIGTELFDDDTFNNESVSEVNDTIVSKREEIDDLLQYGDIYQINNFRAKLISRPNDVMEGANKSDRFYEFEALDKGQYEIMRGFDEENDINQTFVVAGYEGVRIGQIDALGGQPYGDDLNDSAFGNNTSAECTLLSRVDEAIVSNTRRCNATEIGIKSTVWRKITMPNVNSWPDIDATDALEGSGKSVILGQMSRYVKRYSFFKIFVRKSGYGNDPVNVGNPWEALHGGIKFAVLGSTPQEQYNFIRISHPPGLDSYEYKIVPVSGNAVLGDLKSDRSRIFLLNGNNRLSTGGGEQFDLKRGFRLAFSGQDFDLTEEILQVKEFFLGPLKKNKRGEVLSISPLDNGKEIVPAWALVEERYTDPSQKSPTDFNIPRNKVVSKFENGVYKWTYFWDDQIIGTRQSNGPNPGNWRITKGADRFTIGKRTLEGNPPPSWVRRYSIYRYNQVGEPVPNVETDKFPENRDKLNGTGFSITVYAYNDPFDDDDQTKDAAFWAINTRGSGYRDGEVAKFKIRGVDVEITLRTSTVTGQVNYYPYAALSDYPQYEGEDISCSDGPEHQVTYVNELIYKNGDQATYDDLAYCTMRLRAGRSMTSFSQLSAYIKDGLEVERLIPASVLEATVGPNYAPIEGNPNNTKPWPERYSTCFLPEIVYALLTDPEIGVGELVGRYQVNRSEIQNAAIYCVRNGFTWNGTIAQRINIREWIYQQASYNLLDFTITGGRFSLTPSLPTNSFGALDLTATPKITALFSDGNIKNLQVKFLDPAERALFTCVCLYRQEEGNGFPQTKTLTVALSPNQTNAGLPGGNMARDVVETFDMSDSVTTESHCLYFAKMALRARQCIDHNIEFTTVTSELVGVAPGDYIKVASRASHGNSWNNGSIGPAGQVTSTSKINNTVNILYWKPSFGGVREATLQVNDDGITTDGKLFGSVFTVQSNKDQVRCYKISSISYGEEGEVVVTAAHSPLTYKYNTQGSLLLADWDEDDFIVETST